VVKTTVWETERYQMIMIADDLAGCNMLKSYSKRLATVVDQNVGEGMCIWGVSQKCCDRLVMP